MISGMIIIAIVREPPRMVSPQPKASVNKIMPKIPKTMDGMPESVSAATRTILTKMLVDLAYSTMKMAAKMPMTPATSSDKPAMDSVLISEGIMDILSDVQRHANSSGLRLGMPRMSTYARIHTTIAAVISVARQINRNSANEKGFFR